MKDKKILKTNPRRIPCSLADVERARNEGRHEGYAALLSLFLWVRADDFRDSDEDLERTQKRIQFYAEELASGRLKLQEIMDTLFDEHGVKIELR